jgi:diphthine-ammonia ligase
MPERFLGRAMDRQLVEELESIGVDACGENGEFHTFVCSGPLFRQPLRVNRGAVLERGEYAFLPLTVASVGGEEDA